MTNDADKERMLDAIRSLKFPSYTPAKEKLQREGKYNKGTQKALESFYNQLKLRNGKTVIRTKKGQIQVRDKTGRVSHNRNNQYAIKRFKEIIESNKK